MCTLHLEDRCHRINQLKSDIQVFLTMAKRMFGTSDVLIIPIILMLDNIDGF